MHLLEYMYIQLVIMCNVYGAIEHLLFKCIIEEKVHHVKKCRNV